MLLMRIVLAFLLNAAWQVCVIAVIGWLCALLLKPASGSAQHALWLSVLIASALLPLLSLLPQSHFRALSSLTLAIPGPRTAASLWMNGEWQTTASPGSLSGPVALGLGIVLLYGLVLATQVFRLAARCIRTRRLLRSSEVWKANSCAAQVIEECKLCLNVRRVNVRCSQTAQVPFTAGVFRPCVVVPEFLLSWATNDELRVIMAHELAHVRRKDYLINLLCLVVALPVAIHPATAWVKGQLEASRELACDELATRCISSPKVYARALVGLAKTLA